MAVCPTPQSDSVGGAGARARCRRGRRDRPSRAHLMLFGEEPVHREVESTLGSS